MKEKATTEANKANEADPSLPSLPSVQPDSAPPTKPTAQERKNALDDISLNYGVGVKNSADQVSFWCINDNPEQIRDHLRLLYDRLERAHARLAAQIDNLPTVSIVNPVSTAPTASPTPLAPVGDEVTSR